MKPAALFKNPGGRYRFNASYSACSLFQSCAKKFELEKVRGWRDKDRKSSLEFGKAVEKAVEVYHTAGCKSGLAVKQFQENWEPIKDDKTLVYTDRDGDWEALNKAGTELMKLYESLIETGRLKFNNPQFQVGKRRKIFPEDQKYGLLDYVSYLDILCDDAIIDIKTSSNPYPVSPKTWVAKDEQLATYSWVTGQRHVAFLVFVKNTGACKKGDEVSFLEDIQPTLLDNTSFRRGDSAWVIRASGDTVWVVGTEEKYQEFCKAAEGVKGKALDELVAEHGLSLPVSSVTKQRIQFLEGTVSDEDVRFAEHFIVANTLAMVDCHELSEYVPNFGVRYPDNRCLWCSMRGICFNQPELVEELLVRDGADWLLENEQ
jgi:hypothetical protein